MIWIRADANKEIGTGHLMRCLSIAYALQTMGEDVLFLVADENAEKLLAERRQAYRVLHSDYRQLEQELPGLISLLQTQKPKLLLIDSYFVTEEYLRQVKKYVRTAYLDDCGILPYPVDILINYNIYGDQIDYKALLADHTSAADMHLLLGPSYAPLRQEFSETSFEVRDRVEGVLVTTGGSDRYNLAGQFLQQALANEEMGKLHYHVVSGAFNPHLSYLTDMSEKHQNVHIHQNVQNMAELMQNCDLAVSAGGSTLYELCAVGVPFLCFSFVENQERIVQTFEKRGMTCYGGNYRENKEKMLQELAYHLMWLAGDKEMRLIYSSRERELIPRSGALKLAEALCICKS